MLAIVAKLADAADSKSAARKGMRVQLPPIASRIGKERAKVTMKKSRIPEDLTPMASTAQVKRNGKQVTMPELYSSTLGNLVYTLLLGKENMSSISVHLKRPPSWMSHICAGRAEMAPDLYLPLIKLAAGRNPIIDALILDEEALKEVIASDTSAWSGWRARNCKVQRSHYTRRGSEGVVQSKPRSRHRAKTVAENAKKAAETPSIVPFGDITLMVERVLKNMGVVNGAPVIMFRAESLKTKLTSALEQELNAIQVL